MCAPSVSASVIITILWYLNFEISKSSATAVPKEIINDLISCEDKILFKCTLSTFKILPRKGRIAWNLLSLPCLEEPPADSPSTIKISDSSGLLEEQSVSLPGNASPSIIPFRKTDSFAAFAAFLDFAAKRHLFIIALPSRGFFSKKSGRESQITPSTADLASGLPSLCYL